MLDSVIEALRAVAIRAEGYTAEHVDRGLGLTISVEGIVVVGWQTSWFCGPTTFWVEEVVSWQRLGEPKVADEILKIQDEILARLARGEGEEKVGLK